MEKEKIARIVNNCYLGKDGEIFRIKNLLEKKDKEGIYKLRDDLVNVVRKELISFGDLKKFIKENRDGPEAGFAASIIYMTSESVEDDLKAVVINFKEKYKFLGCKGGIEKYLGKKID